MCGSHPAFCSRVGSSRNDHELTVADPDVPQGGAVCGSNPAFCSRVGSSRTDHELTVADPDVPHDEAEVFVAK